MRILKGNYCMSDDKLRPIFRRWGMGKKESTDNNSLLDYIKSIWRGADFGFNLAETATETTLHLDTMGWSCNMQIIGQLARTMFWICYCNKSERDATGRFNYYFSIPKPLKRGRHKRLEAK